MAIDKITAGTLYSYGYKLHDSEGNVWDITGVEDFPYNGNEALFLIQLPDAFPKRIQGNEIGTTYKILSRDLEQLTQEIDGKVPLVEMFKVALKWCYGYDIDFKLGVCDTDYVTYGLTARYEGVDYGFSLDHNPSLNWIEFRLTADSYDMRLNQLSLFQYLYSLNFNIGFPENTTTNLIYMTPNFKLIKPLQPSGKMAVTHNKSKVLQEVLFEKGYTWGMNRKTPSHLAANYIYWYTHINTIKCPHLAFGEESNHFENHDNPLHLFTDYFEPI